MQIGIINGPNLNRIGRREVDVYGVHTMEEELSRLTEAYPSISISYFQSHSEGDIISELYRLDDGGDCQGIILNAGGYSHTSVAILDAIRAITTPVIEVHLSLTEAREEYRHRSLLRSACIGVISGFGLDSYRLAVEAFIYKERNK